MSAWTETIPGQWQRPIGENEAFIKMIGDGGIPFDKDVWSISVTATFKARLGKADETQKTKSIYEMLRDGWKILRFRHPSIASTADDKIVYYATPDCKELELWADESFITLKGLVDPDDVVAGLSRCRYTTIYFLKYHDTVILSLSHWRTDGIGASYLLNAYFEAVVESLHTDPGSLQWGEEFKRLVPAVETALQLPCTPTPAIEGAANRYRDTAKHYIGAMGTPYNPDPSLTPGGTRSCRLSFTQDETGQLQNACRRINVHLEAALHATIATTARCIADADAKTKHHCSTMRQSLRPYLPRPYNGIAGAAGLYTAGYIVKVPARQSWLESAKQYETEYAKGATPDLVTSRRQYALMMKNKFSNAPRPDPPPSGLDFSWIPDADSLVRSTHESAAGSMEVKRLGIGIQVLSRHIYVFAWVFNDQLDLNLVYNEAFYDSAMAEKTVALVKMHLISNLLLNRG